MNVNKESENTSLKLYIQKPRSMASSPIISWQIDGDKMEAVTDFIFLDSKITMNGDYRQEIKRHLFLERKAMTNLGSILEKQRYHFANKSPYSKSYGFSSRHVWMWKLDHIEGRAP